jgi:drug/metabolite transporter (DMT)-like permease
MAEIRLASTESDTRQYPALALLLLPIALVALAFTAIFIKLSVREISANATVFNRLWLATMIFGVWNGFSSLRANDQDERSILLADLPIRDLVLLVSVAVVHVMGRFLWTWSLTQTSAANATVLSNMPPLFTTLGAWLIFGQRFNRRFLVGMVIAVAGALTLGLGDLGTFNDRSINANAFIGDAVALLSSVFYAASFLMVERLRTKLTVESILLWRCLLGTIFMLPIVLTLEDQVFPVSLMGWAAVLGLAAISEALGHGLVVYSLKYFSSAFVTVFLLLEPVIAAIFAWIIFSESLDVINLVAFVLILQGIYLAKTGKGAIVAPSTSTGEPQGE